MKSHLWEAENIPWLIWKMKNLAGGKAASDQRATYVIWKKKKSGKNQHCYEEHV